MAGPRFIHRLCAVSLSCLRGFPAGNVETWLRRTSESTAYVGEAGRPLEVGSKSRAAGEAFFRSERWERHRPCGFSPEVSAPERVLKSLSPASSAWGSRAQAYGKCGCQKTSFSPIHAGSSSTLRRTWVIASRSRTVTVPSSTVSKSTVTQKGVPISSWRR